MNLLILVHVYILLTCTLVHVYILLMCTLVHVYILLMCNDNEFIVVIMESITMRKLTMCNF